MIKIFKQTEIPIKLQTSGKTENSQNCDKYENKDNSKSYIEGSSKFDFKNRIYGHPTVKSVLRAGQHDKCCFCEKDLGDEDGVVEHFRPKGGYRSTKKEKLLKPGYYWLAYEWSNLFFACSCCNSAGNKGSLFPLLDESKRAKSHRDKISEETPLLLDPGGRKNPREHIIFEGQFPRGTVYGKKTIEVCGLDRDWLNTERKKLIDDIDARIAILVDEEHQSEARVDKAKIFIKHSVKADAKFSATAIDYLSTLNISF